MIERPTKEWVERLTRVFGRRKPPGVKLRGDDTGMYSHAYEVRLVRIYQQTDRYYQKNPRKTHYLNMKHLSEQERTIWLMAHQFELEIDSVLAGDRDFVLRPLEGTSNYEIGLADLIFITDVSEVPYLLDFQFYNNVMVEEWDKVRFVQTLHYYVKHYLETRPPFKPTEKLQLLDQWVAGQVQRFDENEIEKFYWYEVEYKYVNREKEKEKNHSMESNETIQQDGVTTSADDGIKKKFPVLKGKPRIKCDYSSIQIDDFFQRLATVPPDSKKPLLSKKAIEWMVTKYFSADTRQLKKPSVKTDLTKEELTLFVHFFAFGYTRDKQSYKNAPFNQLIVMLNQVFPKIVPKEAMEACYKKASTWKNTYKSANLTHLNVYSDD